MDRNFEERKTWLLLELLMNNGPALSEQDCCTRLLQLLLSINSKPPSSDQDGGLESQGSQPYKESNQ